MIRTHYMNLNLANLQKEIHTWQIWVVYMTTFKYNERYEKLNDKSLILYNICYIKFDIEVLFNLIQT